MSSGGGVVFGCLHLSWQMSLLKVPVALLAISIGS